MGHRGMGKEYHYPDNSFESIEAVLKYGADGTEIDVQITKDSVLVIFHNTELSDKTNYQGMLRDYDWADLDSCTYNSPVSQDIHLISVDDLFGRVPDIQKYYFSFDIKFSPKDEPRTPYFRQFVYAIKQVIEKYAMHDRVMIEVGNIQFLQMLQQDEVQAMRFVTGKKFKDALRIAEDLNLYGIGIGSKITRKEIEIAHSQGFRVMTWTPTTPRKNIRAIKKNPDFIQTDQPVHMLKLFGRYKNWQVEK
ncbi:glycerophosphodiester phosphodiesterase [Candidatus Neomarinimicrobiota bacterium]